MVFTQLLWGQDLKRMISAIAVGAVVAGMVTMAVAAPGQCTVTDFGSFDCDVVLDGGGLTFGLPDGQNFAFALVAEDEGLAYLISPDAAPGVRPKELGTYRPAEGETGCWISARDSDDRFCVLVAE